MEKRKKTTKKKSKGNLFKRISAFLHLWLGLISGIIVFIVSITGCLFVFQKEINSIVHHEQFYVEPQQAGPLPLSLLKEKAEKTLGKKATFITTYKAADRAWEFMNYEAGDPKALTFMETVKSYQSAFVNPYTGEVTGITDYTKDFFIIVKYLHWSLLLNTPYGQPIVGYATLIFVILLITGLVLWWPKNLKKANFNKSFKVKWNSGFKRLNYDLHNVFGFYTLIIALVLALTGMVWAMKWFQTTVYAVASGFAAPAEFVVSTSDTTAIAHPTPLDLAYMRTVKASKGNYERIGMNPANGKTGVIYAYAYHGEETYYDADQYQYDQYTGKELYFQSYQDKNNGEKIIGMNYDIHVGSIWGLPGKILAFFASLVAASLPITGFLIWYGRKKKKKTSSPIRSAKVEAALGVQP